MTRGTRCLPGAGALAAALLLALAGRPGAAAASGVVLAGPVQAEAATATPAEARPPAQGESAASAAAWLDALAEEHWRRQLEESPFLRLKEGLPVTRLPDLSYEHAVESAEHAQGCSSAWRRSTRRSSTAPATTSAGSPTGSCGGRRARRSTGCPTSGTPSR